MKDKHILALLILLIAAPALQSQKVDFKPDTIPAIDTSLVHKIDSLNTDTYKTALRVQRKAAKLSSLTKQATMQSNLNSRIKLYVSEIPPKELPVQLSSPEIDSLPQAVKNRKFLFWRR